jgi:GWxTD domain-containing protein
VRDILAAIALEPDHADHWLLLGRLRALGELESEARECFRRAIDLDPRGLEGYLRLADSWKRNWIRTLDTRSALQAVGILDTATRMRPQAADAWLRKVPLLYQGGDLDGAARAAERALWGRPRRPEAAVAVAYVAFRRGEIQRADSLFRDAIPRLDPGFTALFRDPTLLLGERAVDWAAVDPDPTTPENEVELEYWSRVAHAFFLFYDYTHPGLDDRARTYVRYGPPPVAEDNPNGVPLYFRTFASYTNASGTRESQLGGNKSRPPVDFPTPIQQWQYPELGMNVLLQDRSLHGIYQLPTRSDFDLGAHPDPRLLARRGDLVTLGGGLAVFHRLAPPELRIDTRAIVARFGGARGPRLLAQVEVPGGPGDTLRARWLVADTAGRAVARGDQKLAVAACDPAERRGGQFVADVPPGAYRLTVSVSGAGGRRGLFQAPVTVEAGPSGLELSDLVLTCGDPSLLVGGTSARLDANIEGRVSGSQPLSAYVEIYRLAPGPDGATHFEYACNVRRIPGATPGSRRRNRDAGATLVSTSREETYVVGPRRQFLLVPVQGLPPGRYQLEVQVRDQVAGTVATRSVEFVRE